MQAVFSVRGEGWAERTAVVVVDCGFGPAVSITFSDGTGIVVSDQQAKLVHEFLGKALDFIDNPPASTADQDAQQAVEGGAVEGGADTAPEFDFAAQSAATDGGLSAEVVRTLRTPGPATGFAEKADDNG